MTLTILLALIIAAAAYARPAKLSPRVIGFWQRVANCETGGNWRWGAQFRSPIYEGGVGFAVTTWRAWAGELRLTGRYPHAYLAPRLVQIRVADYGYRVHRGYWGCIANGGAGSYPG